MKTTLKQLANRIMYRLFGYIPYPTKKDTIRFTPVQFKEREYTAEEFNSTFQYIYKLNRTK